MSTETVRYDFVEIDAKARQLRADMLASAGRRAWVWLRKPRALAIATQGRTA